MSEPSEPAVVFIWAEYRRWAATAGRLTTQATRMRTAILILGLSGLALGAIGAQIESLASLESAARDVTSGFALVSGLCATIAAFLARQAEIGGMSAGAARSRSVAEGLKSLAWRRAASPPTDGDDPSFEFVTRISTAGHGILLVMAGESSEPCPPTPLTVKDYDLKRVQDQLEYYRRRADEHAASVERAGKISLLMGIVALAITSVGAYSSGTSWAFSAAWGAAIAGCAAALTTWYQSSLNACIAAGYQRTATLIEAANTKWHALPEAKRKLVDLVTACEDLFEAEHLGWKQAALEQSGPKAELPESKQPPGTTPARLPTPPSG